MSIKKYKTHKGRIVDKSFQTLNTVDIRWIRLPYYGKALFVYVTI